MIVLEVGQAFGKYRILRVLGRGGMGIVYLAEDQSLGRQVALKVISRELSSDDRFERMFRHEARTIASLNHPNIVTIHSMEKIEGRLAIDMPYIDGGALAARRVATPQLLRYLRQVLAALETCHLAGIVHRDVKPSNILLSQLDHALLSDFGLAKVLAEHQVDWIKSQTSSIFVGTPRYAPPEAWDGAACTPVWDVYAVGMILYEAVSPTAPYDANTPLAFVKQLVVNPLPELSATTSNISGELCAAINAMIDRDPAQRPQNAAEALQRLNNAPESQGQDDLENPTVIRGSIRAARQVRLRRYCDFIRYYRPRFVRYTVFAAIACAAIAGLFVFRLYDVTPRLSQAPAVTQSYPSSSGQLFDVVDNSGPTVLPGHFFIVPGSSPDTHSMVCYGKTGLLMLEAVQHDESNMDVSGDWAEYADQTARSLRYGTVTGRGTWVTPQRELALTLELKDAMEGSKTNRSLFVRASAEAGSDVDFVRRIEENDYITAILYNEMRPRGVEWLDAFETKWLSRSALRVGVPFAASALELTLDGGLSETAWRASLSDPEVRATALDRAKNRAPATLHFRYTPQALWVGARVDSSITNPLIAVSLLTHFDIPLAHARQFQVYFQSGSAIASYALSEGQQVAWDCDWKIASVARTRAQEFEIVIPYAGIGIHRPPETGERWRIDCSIGEASPSTDMSPAGWRKNHGGLAEHGTILMFAPSPQSSEP
ncbi:MAG: serine/threonine protein kinase [Candidatus Hydrogenedentes bacterium]|nr:serine/threonine protein kinase [Candidatus Hydrogenedentota bacterium]